MENVEVFVINYRNRSCRKYVYVNKGKIMKLSDIVVREATIADLNAKDRNGAIKEIMDKLVEAKKINPEDVQDIIKAIIKREKQGSTGLGKGVAVPHVKHPAVKELIAAVAKSNTGIDFAALDRAPVYIIFLLLSPQDKPEEHLKAMKTIFTHLQKENFRRFLRQAENVEQINEIIDEAEEITA